MGSFSENHVQDNQSDREFIEFSPVVNVISKTDALRGLR